MVADLKLPKYCSEAVGSTSHNAGSPPALQSGAMQGRNKLHSSGFSSPCTAEKGKEIFSRDINLHLNTINYLLYFGCLAKRLTFKAFVSRVPRELRQFLPDVSHTHTHRAQAVPSRFLNPCSLFSTAVLRYTQPSARSGPALLQKTSTQPEGASEGSSKEAQICSPTDCFTTTEKSERSLLCCSTVW